MNVIDEVLDLATEVLRINPSDDDDNYQCNMAIEAGELITSGDLLYKLPETPDYLVKIECMKILATEICFVFTKKNPYEREMEYVSWRGDRLLKGLMAVEFDLIKLRTWRKKEIEKRLTGIDGVKIVRRDGVQRIVKIVEEDGIGKALLSDGEKRTIGHVATRTFKLLSLIQDQEFGGEYTLDRVFEAIRLPSDKDKYPELLLSKTYESSRKRIIGNTIKELQNDGVLKGLIRMKTSNNNKRLIIFH